MNKKINILLKVKDETLVPVYSSNLAAGADVFAAIDTQIVLKPNQSLLVPTGVFVDIPEGFEIQIRPRSGLAYNNKITVLNTPGTIDADYRGEIGIILINHGKENFVIKPKMRIAQLVVASVFQANFMLNEELTTTTRGSGGFGHSGLF